MTAPLDPEPRAGDTADGSRFVPLGRRELLAIIGFWTFMALLSAANQVVDPRGVSARWAGVGEPIMGEFFVAYLWAILTPAIFWLSAWARLDRSGWVRPVLALGAAAIGCAIFADVIEDVFEIHVLGASAQASPTSPLQSLLRLWFLNDLMIFVAVLAAGFAREYFVRYRARQDEAVRLEARAALLEAQLAEARLEALRMQVNPHFLFNTLHAISSLVHRDPDGVRSMVAKLANLLRTTLKGSGEAEVSLERELEFLEDYLEIMQVRFQGRLEVEFDVDCGLLEARVPNLILQPLVENAVKHGVGGSEGPVRVVVTGAAESDRLVLGVLDTGPGLPGGAGGAPTTGIGLQNVRERLAHLYGGRGDLTVESRPEGGVRAEIRVPLRVPEAASSPSPSLTLAGEPS